MNPGNSLQLPPVPTTTCWSWDTSGAVPVVSGFPSSYSSFTQTKTGLTPTDLQNFVGVPLSYCHTNPPTPVDPNTIYEWLRWAEDEVEQNTSLLLCQTWVASPPAFTVLSSNEIGLVNNTPGLYQVRGYDYDLEDSGYDFMFSRAQDEGWMYQTLRYRPVQSMTYNVSGNAATAGVTAVKNVAYIYPLLNTFFRVPWSWFVEEKDYGMIRLVPATNVMMLPLFAMQLAFMGFAENVPGAIWYQYTAGLTPYDYSNRYAFVKRLVLALAAQQALAAIQGTINLGNKSIQTQVDGLMQRRDFDARGPFAGLIETFKNQSDDLMKKVKNMLAGPVVGVL